MQTPIIADMVMVMAEPPQALSLVSWLGVQLQQDPMYATASTAIATAIATIAGGFTSAIAIATAAVITVDKHGLSP